MADTPLLRLHKVWREYPSGDGSFAALKDVDGVIVDCRSSTYVAAWRPSGAQADKWVSVNVVRERNGVRTVVSHNAKHTRGLVARHLLESGKDPGTAKSLHKLVNDRWNAELERAAAGWTLTVVEHD